LHSAGLCAAEAERPRSGEKTAKER